MKKPEKAKGLGGAAKKQREAEEIRPDINSLEEIRKKAGQYQVPAKPVEPPKPEPDPEPEQEKEPKKKPGRPTDKDKDKKGSGSKPFERWGDKCHGVEVYNDFT